MLEPVRDLEGAKGSCGGVEVPGGLPGLLLAGLAHQPRGAPHGGDQAARHPCQTVIGDWTEYDECNGSCSQMPDANQTPRRVHNGRKEDNGLELKVTFLP